jgi:hypothetical protein
MSKSKKLVFFGNERLATGITSTNVLTLKALLNNGYEVLAVLPCFHNTEARLLLSRQLLMESAKQELAL